MMVEETTTTRRMGDEPRHRIAFCSAQRGFMKSLPMRGIKSSLFIALGVVAAAGSPRTTTAAFQLTVSRAGRGLTVPSSNGGAVPCAPSFGSSGTCNHLTSIHRVSPTALLLGSGDKCPPEGDSCSPTKSDQRDTSPATGTTATRPSFPSPLKAAVTTLLLSSVLLLGDAHPSTAAYSVGDGEESSPAVESAIAALRQARGSSSDTFKAFEAMGDIITEGKGVGGSINYKGVQLERGYVADEDTTIYNPGLTLLTETEKSQLVRAVIEARASGLTDGTWNDDSQLAYEFLKDKLDPLHMAELGGYLAVFPIVVGVVYAATLAVQQFLRDLFPAAYIVGVVLVIAPALALVALGPS